MRKFICIGVIVLFVAIVGIGCSPDSTEKELDPSDSGVQEGYIIEISDSGILVVSDITKEESFHLTQNEIVMEGIGKEAVWYSVTDVSPYERGQRVRAKADMMQDSYPGQAKALQVQIIEDK